ncbi:MAG: hypothetical protein M5U15_08030 [Kiritimatiellae bacterium]|nr:hypothetical protein [Kiritimatiellia bacterium]
MAKALSVKPRTYPVAKTIWRALVRVALVLSVLVVFVIGMEMLRLVALLRRIHPLLAYAAMALLAIAALAIVVRVLLWRAARQTLFPPPPPGQGDVQGLEAFCSTRRQTAEAHEQPPVAFNGTSARHPTADLRH